jgi:hypothetical protein
MRFNRRLAGALLVGGLVAGCGRSSPSAPSAGAPNAAVSAAEAQALVSTALTQATTTLFNAGPDGSSWVRTSNCPLGGSMTITSTFVTGGPLSSPGMITSTRIEFNGCRSQTVTTDGDPYVELSSEYVFGPSLPATLPSSLTLTTRITGGTRFDAGTSQGRVRYDCALVMSRSVSETGSPAVQITASGTIALEQPLGTLTVRPCGPPAG